MKLRLVNLSLVASLAYWGHVDGASSIHPSFSVCLHLPWKGHSSKKFSHAASAVRIGGQTQITRQLMFRLKRTPPTLLLQPLKVQRPFRLRCTSGVQEGTNYLQSTSVKHPDFENFAREKALASGVNLSFFPAEVFSTPTLSDDSSRSEAVDADSKNAFFEMRGTIKSLVFVCNDEPVLVIIR